MGKPQITAHRGASGLAPENTLSAIRLAIEIGADFAEIDVQESADGGIFLLHDASIDRTTDKKGIIWELTSADLRAADAGSWYSPWFANEPVPDLSTVIDSMSGMIKLNIELKTNGHQIKLAERVVAIIEEKKFIDQCIVTSFDREEISKVKELNPGIKTGLIFSKIPKENIWTAAYDLFSVHKKLVSDDFMKDAHQFGKEVHVWTVNKEKEMRKMIGYGVDNIITNYPGKTFQVLKTWKV
ncbi:MAG TPA: glycerophosphodiester phosphodiesterase [Bacteroidetes bacterium]|nr:glycerophosphodiester phosphodiesterase [Bacteroidota bacterium]